MDRTEKVAAMAMQWLRAAIAPLVDGFDRRVTFLGRLKHPSGEQSRTVRIAR